MAIQHQKKKFIKTFKTVIASDVSLKCNQEIANKISETLISSGWKSLSQPTSDLLIDLNSEVTHLVLSNPQLKTQTCVDFFNFLNRNQCISSYKLDLQTYLSLICRLFKDRKFILAKDILTSVAVNEYLLQHPISVTASMVEKCCQDAKVSTKLFDMLFRVYSENHKFDEALEMFEYMKSKGLEIDERSCIVYLLSLKRSNQVDSTLSFFQRMLESGAQVSVYSMTIVVDLLCKRGDITRARELMEASRGSRGVKPNLITYQSLIIGYLKTGDFEEVNKILSLLDKDGVDRNVVTYTILIDGFSSSGKMEEAEKLFEEMRERNIEPDIYVYTSMINGNCRSGNVKRAFALFDILTERGLTPNEHTYGALLNGLCKAGQMEAAGVLLNEIQSKGIDLNLIIFNTLTDGYCRKGMIDEAIKLQGVMEKKGLEADVFAYNTIASGLCKLNRMDEAKKLLTTTMVDKGVAPNTVSFTTLIDIYCKEGSFVEAKRMLSDMEKKGVKPNTVTYNALIDGYSKKGNMKEAHKLKDVMEGKGLIPDVYTYTSLIHGNCIAGKVDDALKLFRDMPSRRSLVHNVVTYTAMISGLSKEGRSDEAFQLYDEMTEVGLVPDDAVYASLVSSLHSNKP